MKGWRTIIVNAAIVAAIAGLDFLSKVDWTQYLNPSAAIVAMAVIACVMRVISTTPIGEKV